VIVVKSAGDRLLMCFTGERERLLHFAATFRFESRYKNDFADSSGEREEANDKF
jgi:hypothetical protein